MSTCERDRPSRRRRRGEGRRRHHIISSTKQILHFKSRKTSTLNYGIGYLSRDDDIGEEESVQRHEESTTTASQALPHLATALISAGLRLRLRVPGLGNALTSLAGVFERDRPSRRHRRGEGRRRLRRIKLERT